MLDIAFGKDMMREAINIISRRDEFSAASFSRHKEMIDNTSHTIVTP
jgi:hypothetical protein